MRLEHTEHRAIIVLSADRRCFERAQRAVQAQQRPIIWFMSDPTDLLNVLRPRIAHSRVCITGIVFDVTAPIGSSWWTAPMQTVIPGTLETAWQVAGLLALLGAIPRSGFILISKEQGLESALRQAGIAVSAQIDPDADDSEWSRAHASADPR